MNCYDCGTQGRVEAAVATCVNCGAGMCAAHTRTEQEQLDRHGIGNPVHLGTTRKLVCTSCNRILAHRALHTVG